MKRKYSPKQSPQPTPKKLPRIVRGLFQILLLAGIGYGVYWFLGWETVEVNNIDVTGQVSLSPEDIKNKARQQIIKSKKPWYASTNIFLTPSSQIERALQESFPRIKTVKVEKSLPDTLRVQVEEREPYWKICFPDECRGVALDGVVIDRVSVATDYATLEVQRNPTAGEALLTPSEVQWFQAIQEQFEEHLQVKPVRFNAQIIIEDQIKVLHVYLDDDTYVLIDDETELPYQIVALASVIDSLPENERLAKEYYDIRVKKRIYYQ